jgi:hypothetical protein
MPEDRRGRASGRRPGQGGALREQGTEALHHRSGAMAGCRAILTLGAVLLGTLVDRGMWAASRWFLDSAPLWERAAEPLHRCPAAFPPAHPPPPPLPPPAFVPPAACRLLQGRLLAARIKRAAGEPAASSSGAGGRGPGASAAGANGQHRGQGAAGPSGMGTGPNLRQRQPAAAAAATRSSRRDEPPDEDHKVGGGCTPLPQLLCKPARTACCTPALETRHSSWALHPPEHPPLVALKATSPPRLPCASPAPPGRPPRSSGSWSSASGQPRTITRF